MKPARAAHLPRTPVGGPAIGSTGSFGVSSDFGLAGGEDSVRFPDATTVVLERT